MKYLCHKVSEFHNFLSIKSAGLRRRNTCRSLPGPALHNTPQTSYEQLACQSSPVPNRDSCLRPGRWRCGEKALWIDTWGHGCMKKLITTYMQASLTIGDIRYIFFKATGGLSSTSLELTNFLISFSPGCRYQRAWSALMTKSYTYDHASKCHAPNHLCPGG